MYSASDIANWFLRHNEEKVSSGADGISNLKLQKLLYYAQGASLALNGHPLFKEDIYAWKHGPVVPEVYYKFNKYGSNSIPVSECSNIVDIASGDIDLLEQVYDIFGQFSAWKLRDLTHRETPWKTTRQSEVIDSEKIKQYFLEHYITTEDEQE